MTRNYGLSCTYFDSNFAYIFAFFVDHDENHECYFSLVRSVKFYLYMN